MAKRKEKVELRYYTVDKEFPVLAILGSYRDFECVGDTPKPASYHFHNLMEIGYCHDGHGVFSVENEEFLYEPGTFTIIPKNILHETDSTENRLQYWEYLFVEEDRLLNEFFLANFVGDSLFKGIEDGYVVGNKESHPVLASLIMQILDEYRFQKSYHKEKVNLLMLSLFIDFARMKSSEIQLNDSVINRDVVMRALEVMNNRYAEGLTVASLAKEMNMSEQYFRKIFKNAVGMSPLDHLNKVRIQKACSLLLRADTNIINVAMACGFASVSSFNRNFAKYMECTPTAYRSRHLCRWSVDKSSFRTPLFGDNGD